MIENSGVEAGSLPLEVLPMDPSQRWIDAGFPHPTPVKIPVAEDKSQTDARDTYRQRLQELRERKEAITEASMGVIIDKAGILGIETQLGEFTDIDSYGFRSQEEHETAKLARHQELMRTIGTIAALPERLSFEPGVTLIIGDNGLGKSTLARALLYAAEITDQMRQPNFEGEYDTYQEARDWVLLPSSSSPDDVTERYQAGLAPLIARHIRALELQHGAPGFRYYNVPSEFGRLDQLTRDLGRSDHRYDSDGHNVSRSGQHDRRGRSHRQTIDNMVDIIAREKVRRSERSNNPKVGAHAWPDWGNPQILVVDEPETGMDITSHRKIVDYLQQLPPDGSMMLVPTNSLVLYESDLPRIDLAFPERGVHRPSDYLA